MATTTSTTKKDMVLSALESAKRLGYKHTKLGWIPEEWDIRKLDTVCEKITDGTHFSPKTSSSGDFMYITSKNVKDGFLDLSDVEWVTKDVHDEIYKRCDVQYGDVLLTKDGAKTGNACLNTLEEPFSLLSSAAFLRADRKHALNEYLLHWIRSPRGQWQIRDAMAGQAITRITLETLRGFEFIFPQVPEQRRIAQVLGAWDRAIATVQQLLAAQQERKRGLMQELLTGKRRFPGFAGKWKEVRLHQLGAITNGGTPSTAVDEYWNGDIPWFTPTEITALNGRTTIANSGRMLTATGLANCTGSMLPVGSVIVCTRATVGIAAILTNPGTTNQGFKNIAPNEKVSSKFLYYQIMTNAHALQRLACGSTFPEVSMKDFRNLGVLLPERAEQDRICEMLDAMDLEIETLNDQITHLTTQKRGLMQVLLTGEKRFTTT